eukprot:487861-Pyramimonas_sp.AAC.1
MGSKFGNFAETGQSWYTRWEFLEVKVTWILGACLGFRGSSSEVLSRAWGLGVHEELRTGMQNRGVGYLLGTERH